MGLLFMVLISATIVVVASTWPQFDRPYGAIAAYERKLTQNLATILFIQTCGGVVMGTLSPEPGSLRLQCISVR